MATPSALDASIDPARLDCISAAHYEKNGYPFAEWAWLRKHDPVRWIEHPDYDGFWAITMRPTPMRAMISIDSGDTAEANVRPLNDLSGAGRISTRGCL